MITTNSLSMHQGVKLLYDDVTLNLTTKNRYGVVGANGTGKSTFLKLLAGQEEPSLGDINIPKNETIGWLKQDQFRYENDRIVDVVIQGKQALWQAMKEKEKLFEEDIWNDKTSTELAETEEIINHYDGYTAEPFAQTLLTGLGIDVSKHHEPLSVLSGGFKLRVLLAQALFEQPDLLLLDEPTNHLDIMTIAWLETYLKNEFKGLLIFVSHDLGFVNSISTHILDIDYGEITPYVGNYHQFEKEKALIMDQKLHELKHMEKKIAHMQSFVDRFKYKATKARQAQSRAKMIEKMELPEIKKTSHVSPNFNFTQKRPSGKTVLTIDKLSKSFNEKVVLKDVSINIQRGEKIAIIGHNGIGKSTLLKCILNLIDHDTGTYEWGYETQIAYFAQDHHELLNEHISAIDWLTSQMSTATSTEIRNALGQMLFTGDEVKKDVLHLSGGEAARLLMSKIMLSQANVLILDEPTNHLDIDAIEALAKALRTYEGSLILVSHDRHFVSKIANRVLALTEEGINDFKGSYKEYLQQFGEDYLSRAWLGGH